MVNKRKAEKVKKIKKAVLSFGAGFTGLLLVPKPIKRTKFRTVKQIRMNKLRRQKREIAKLRRELRTVRVRVKKMK